MSAEFNSIGGHRPPLQRNSCQYIYNLSASALGAGADQVDILINGQVAGGASFGLR